MGLFLGNSKVKVTAEGDQCQSYFYTSFSLPDTYQEVEWVRADTGVGAYIDLGFSFDGAAKIYLTQWINDVSATCYPFGAVENNGVLRCCFSCPYGNSASLYGSNGENYLVLTRAIQETKTPFIMVLKPGELTLTNTQTDSSYTHETQSEYTMTNHLYLFAQNYNGTVRFGGIRQLGKFKYYDKDNKLICNLIPCYRKSDGEIGMYDTVRKTFFTNIGTGTFTKGSDV